MTPHKNLPSHSPGASPIEMLPSELLAKILLYATSPAMGSAFQFAMPKSINADVPNQHRGILTAFLTSKTFYEAAVIVAYRAPNFHSVLDLEPFTRQIISRPHFGKFVRKLDFCSPIPRQPTRLQANTPNLLKQLLSHTPLLRELFISSDFTHLIDQAVLELILCDLPYLETLHFEAGNSVILNQAFMAIQHQSVSNSMSNLSMTKCSWIDWKWLLSGLPQLRSLNASHTRISTDALFSIPNTARLEHLDLSYCSALSGSGLARFIGSHPAAETLTSLKIVQDPEDRFLSADDIDLILSNLSGRIKILDLRYAPTSPGQIPNLKRLWSLECLSAGSTTQLQDLEKLILADSYELPDADQNMQVAEDSRAKYSSTLGPLRVAIPVCTLRRRLNSIAPLPVYPPGLTKSKLRYLDITTITYNEQLRIMDSVLLGNCSRPLNVVELSPWAMNWNSGLIGEVVRGAGWKAMNVGKRYWIQRA